MKGFPLSEKTLAFLESIRAWFGTFVPGAVDLTEEAVHPPDEEYGLELILKFAPREQNASALTIDCAPDAIGFILDDCESFARKRRLKMCVLSGSRNTGILHYAPVTALGNEEMLQVCKAVAAANIRLEIATILNRLSNSCGYIELPEKRFSLEGLGGSFAFPRALSRFGLAKIQAIQFSPWQSIVPR